jgi:mannosylglycerate hydrolase
MPNYTLHVVSHTHWDREWYLPFQLFRIKLVDLVDRLLELLDRDPDFNYFHMDGQSIILEDYLAIRPENEAKIREHVRTGRIIVGPFYQLNDQFLTSAESNVRSLLVGMRIAEDFGGTMKIGYSPDQFGNISQLPQILLGFGIDNAIFGRGYQMTCHKKMEFLWESPDGSRVLTAVMPLWYNNAQHIPADTDKAVEMMNGLIERMGPWANAPHLLLMNGVDHLEAQYNVTKAIKGVNKRLKNATVVQTTMQAYIDALKSGIAKSKAELEVVRGELREDDHSQVLAGTLSSRMYLKQGNERSQTWLERYAEPLSSIAWMHGMKYPWGELDYAWRMLMENHAHDSICGCSIDQVHKEMVNRFEQVDQIGEELAIRATQSIASQIKSDSDSVVVFNTLTHTRTGKVKATIDFPIGEKIRGGARIDYSMKVPAMELRDTEDNLVPFKLLSAQNFMNRILNPEELPMAQWVRRFDIEFIAEDVPACGYKTYKAAVADRYPQSKESIASSVYSENMLSNGIVNVDFEPVRGVTIERVDLEDGLIFSGLSIFEDIGEVGDEYRHFDLVQDVAVNSIASNAQTSVIDSSPISATLRIDQTLMLPESLSADLRTRSEKTIACPITTYVTVTKGSPRVDFRVEVENNAKDHRLRALFPTDLDTDVSCAEGQYDVVTRPIEMNPEWTAAMKGRPQQSWVDVNEGTKGLCVINKGLPEYELYDDTGKTLALTLLRCVEKLAGGPESTISTKVPEAQCLGNRVFEYAVYPHTGTWQEAQVWRQAHDHNVPMMTLQIGAQDGTLPSEQGFITIEPAELVLTAIKRAEKQDKLIVRFFNTTDKPAKGKVTVHGAKAAEIVNLKEEPQSSLKITKDGSVRLDVAAKKIITLAMSF